MEKINTDYQRDSNVRPLTCNWNHHKTAEKPLASHADVLTAGTRDEPLRMSAWEAKKPLIYIAVS